MGMEKLSKKGISRRGFLGTSFLLAVSVLLVPKLLNKNEKKVYKNVSFEDLAKYNEQKERERIPEVVSRADWYKSAWQDENEREYGIRHRYSKKIGDIYNFFIKGPNIDEKEKRTRRVSAPSYLEEGEEASFESLERFYSNIVIHHTEMKEHEIEGLEDDPVKQMQFLLNSQILAGFGDIAYHFAITRDGQIFEGVPLTHLGQHAGNTKQAKEYQQRQNAELPDIFREPNKERKDKKIIEYKESMKHDPDYGSLGVVLLGNLDSEPPTEAQLEALPKLLNYLKGKLHIPKENIVGHKDIDTVVAESGYTSTREKPKSCPGNEFDYQSLVKDLEEDTEQSKLKIDKLKLPRE